jgi:hypothetical protein
MRRVIMMVALWAIGIAATAGEQQQTDRETHATERVTGVGQDVRPGVSEGQGHCSFTARGSVSAPGVQLDFACTATEETCKEAIQKALECAKLTVSIVKSQFKK